VIVGSEDDHVVLLPHVEPGEVGRLDGDRLRIGQARPHVELRIGQRHNLSVVPQVESRMAQVGALQAVPAEAGDWPGGQLRQRVDARVAGGRGDHLVRGDRDAEVRRAVRVPGDPLHAGCAPPITGPFREVHRVVDDPVFRAVRRPEEAVMAGAEHAVLV